MALVITHQQILLLRPFSPSPSPSPSPSSSSSLSISPSPSASLTSSHPSLSLLSRRKNSFSSLSLPSLPSLLSLLSLRSSQICKASSNKEDSPSPSPSPSPSSSSSSSPSSDPWLPRLPDRTVALYAHSLPCIEAWLKSLGFDQNPNSPESWTLKRPDWHAELAMDVTELAVKYLKSGPGSLPRDVERKFSYALSRQDLENAILGGP